MSNLTIDSGITREYQLHLIMSEQSQSIADNTTTIAYELKLTSGSYNFGSYGAGWEVWINGTRVAYHNRNTSDRYSIAKNSSWTIASGTTIVTHNTDGTKTITCSASLDMGGSPAPGPLSCASTSWTLTTIPRASTLTIPTLTIEQSATLTVVPADNSFTHEITYEFFDLSGTIASLSAGVTSTTWTPPNTFYAKLPNSTSGNVSITLETYTGGTLIGSVTYTVPVNVGTSIKPTVPTVSLSPVNTNAWLNTEGLYVGGYTRIRVQSSASPGSGASIASYTVSGAFSATGANVTSGVLTAGTKSVTVTVTDTRGRTNVKTETVTFLDYASPALTTFSGERGEYSGGVWTSDVNGNHIRINASATVSLSGEGNTGTISVTLGGNAPDVTSAPYYIWTSTVNTTSYTVSGTVTDSVGNSSTRTLTISTVEVPLNIDVDLPGVAAGMVAQTQRVFEIAPGWQLKIGGILIPDPNNAGKTIAMKSDGTGLEWI